MTNPTLRTKRQLHNALACANAEANHANERRTQAESKLREHEEALKADGWTPQYAYGIYINEVPIVGWIAPDRDAERKALAEQTRRDTLRTVIDALNLDEYKTTTIREGFIRMISPTPDTDRLWDDLNTALEVREADKHAATQREIADRVAGLAPRPTAKKAPARKPAAKRPAATAKKAAK